VNACYIANKVIISFSRDHQHFSLDEKKTDKTGWKMH